VATGRGPAVQLPTPVAGSLPAVPALAGVVTPDAVVVLSTPLSAPRLTALSKLRGVNRVETVDTGTVDLGGAPVVAFGIDPGSFRNFTPAASAASDQLWRYVAAGSLVSSYSQAADRAFALGSVQTVTPAAASPDSSVKGWLGAFASIGLPGVDLLVSHQYSPALGLTPDSGLVVSAPGLAGTTLQSELRSALPGGAVELLHPDQLPTNLAGRALDATTRQKIVAAALSRVGRPYVWGGAGPNQFDCSGLVQWSYRQAGILTPRVAAQQFLTGDHIPLAAAQPGDLLFWTYDPSDPGYVDHDAIYLGNGLMVAASHAGTNVAVLPVPSNLFAGAVAVVLAS
jgi:peptidoglycan DL-endopeptidase CwlO